MDAIATFEELQDRDLRIPTEEEQKIFEVSYNLEYPEYKERCHHFTWHKGPAG